MPLILRSYTVKFFISTLVISLTAYSSISHADITALYSPITLITNHYQPACHKNDFGLRGSVKSVRRKQGDLFFGTDGWLLINGAKKCKITSSNKKTIIELFEDGFSDIYEYSNNRLIKITFGDEDFFFEFQYSHNANSGSEEQVVNSVSKKDFSITVFAKNKFDVNGKLIQETRKNSNSFYNWGNTKDGTFSTVTTHYPDGFITESKYLNNLYGENVYSEEYNSRSASRTISQCTYQVDSKSNWVNKECDRKTYHPNGEVQQWGQSISGSEARAITYY